VAGFWQFMTREATRATGRADASYAVWLASRCVGRWPSGAPVVLAPERDDPRRGEDDSFLFGDDADGLACPLGAHVRRANPRDVLKPYTTTQSLSMTEAHRLLRRGRAYGPPLFDPVILGDPSSPLHATALLNLAEDGAPRGIHFFCVNASIASQFEFVQQTWCNNPRFAGLTDNKDPLIGDNARSNQASSYMAIPHRPVGIRTAVLPRFVTVRGGAYFFMPGITALRFLATSGLRG
jgi:deferrochelatase/peroxidase EfeB